MVVQTFKFKSSFMYFQAKCSYLQLSWEDRTEDQIWPSITSTHSGSKHQKLNLCPDLRMGNGIQPKPSLNLVHPCLTAMYILFFQYQYWVINHFYEKDQEKLLSHVNSWGPTTKCILDWNRVTFLIANNLDTVNMWVHTISHKMHTYKHTSFWITHII